MAHPYPAARLAIAAVLAAGCGAATPSANEASADPLAPSSLYPMTLGSQWVYDLRTGPEPPSLGIYEVVEADGPRRTIAVNRGMDAEGTVGYGEPDHYDVTAEGIRHVASGAWVLKAPIRVGATWPALRGRTARVQAVDVGVEVIAGTFDDCVSVVETGEATEVRTVYCPGVGPAILEVHLELQLASGGAEIEGRLRSYDIR
ncbi:MAG: hypothetical protein ACFCGT_00650 [Sandaracinaceae bacterium]